MAVITENNTIGEDVEEEGKEDQRSEAADLLEEFWFFGNLFQRKNTDTLMKRWSSDPCPSSSDNQEMMSFTDYPPKEPPQVAGSPEVKPTESKKSSDSCRVLHRTPSLPPCLGKDEVVEEQQRGSRSHPRMSKSNISKGTLNHVTRDMEEKSKEANEISTFVTSNDEHGPSMDQIYQLMLVNSGPSSSHAQNVGNGYGSDGTKPSPRALLRVPSLPPPSVGRDEVVEKQRGSQSHPRLSKSSRQASLNLSEILPPRRSSKVHGALYYLSTDKEMKRRILNRTKSMRSRCELESEEVQGFKDLGFTFDRKDLNPTLVNILPGLQEKNKEEADKGGKEVDKKGPYLSESWLSHNFAPPIPKWTPKGGGGGGGGSPDDLKAHIKFWARAVASNVGQEC